VNFGEALRALSNGDLVTRAGWNGAGQWIALQRPDETAKMTRPYLYIRTVNSELVPWVASQSDLLAEDWSVTAPPSTTEA
jgi:hypothetical protein